MSMRLEMLQVARLAPRLLAESSDLVRSYLKHQQNPDGGFKNRQGVSDLYYTVFALDSMAALTPPSTALHPTAPLLPDDVASSSRLFLESFGDGRELDLVHLCCVARCRAALSLTATEANARLLARVEQFRAPDGGYRPTPAHPHSTVYASFLAFGAYQDLHAELPDSTKLLASLDLQRSPDGAWANEPNLPAGATNATAAAVSLLRQLHCIPPPSVADWLLARAHPQGGFLATPTAPLPDLLSTATALHALAGLERSFRAIHEPCLDFIDSLWTNEGAFHGHWAEETPDVEYTFYGLLALGHLSL